MNINKMLFAVVLLFLFMTSCEKEELIEAASQEEDITLSSDKSKESPEEAAQRMRVGAVEFYELIGRDPATLGDNFKSRNTSSVYNTGWLNHYYPKGTNNHIDPLNFGTRTGATQWVSLDLTNSQAYVVPDAYTHNRPGKLNIFLRGVDQTVTFDFSVSPNSRNAVITPTTTGVLDSRLIPATSFTLGGPMEIIIYASTYGEIWVLVKKSGVVVFSSLYTFNYNTAWDSRNGGNINLIGFGPPLGIQPPWTPAGFITNYSGYCGWF